MNDPRDDHPPDAEAETEIDRLESTIRRDLERMRESIDRQVESRMKEQSPMARFRRWRMRRSGR